METITNFFEFELFHFGDHSLTVFELFSVVLIFLITHLIIWIISKGFYHRYKRKNLDKGSSVAVLTLVKYILWVISIAIMLEVVGISVTLLLAGSAALLVGIGLGLQQTFNDILSGIIMLFDQTVKIDDVLEIDGDIVKITEIGLRTSKGIDVNQIIIILPNSLITNNKVINWSHQTKNTLFRINVGVAYGSDIELVSKVLIESATEHPEVSHSNGIECRLIEFGNSSIDFEVLFFSQNAFIIGKTKSDIRKKIYRKFIENNISIPFPQMDVHLKSKVN